MTDTIGNFLVWSELELGLGVICGCAPAIHKLLKGLLREPAGSSGSTPVRPGQYQSRRLEGPPAPPKKGFGSSSSSEKMHALSPQQTPQSISHPTKTFQSMTTSTTMSNRSLHVDEHSGNGSTRGLVEYDAPVDIEAVGLWGPRV